MRDMRVARRDAGGARWAGGRRRAWLSQGTRGQVARGLEGRRAVGCAAYRYLRASCEAPWADGRRATEQVK